MSKKHRKPYSREFKLEAVRLITDKKYSIAEASRNLGVEYSVLRRWKHKLADDPVNAFPGKGQGKPADQEKRNLQRELHQAKFGKTTLAKPKIIFTKIEPLLGDPENKQLFP